jgi:hypothetical protein
MSLTTVAELKSALGIGSLYSDALIQEVCDATDAVLLPMLWNNYTFNIAHSNSTNTGTLYFQESVVGTFYVGQSVTITGNGSKHNGNKTITAVGTYSITYAITGNNNTAAPYHPVNPLGQVAAETYADWTTDAAVQQAALQISVDIWQARQTTSSGGVAVDFQPGPWKMSSSLLARVRGLIAHALSPNSMVG